MNEPRRFQLDSNGVPPILMHNNAGLLAPKEDKGRDPLQWERDHILDLTYHTDAGELYVPARAIRKMLINGCRFVTDKPKGSSFKSFAPLLEAALVIEEDGLLGIDMAKVQECIMVVNLDPSK